MLSRKRARSAIDIRPALLAAALAIPVWMFPDAAGAQSPPKQWRTPETDEDLAVLMLEQHDPADLMVSDWEFILSFRDASPIRRYPGAPEFRHPSPCAHVMPEPVSSNFQRFLKRPDF